MTKFVIALLLVVAIIGSSLLVLLRSRNLPQPSREVLDRVKERNRELDAQERLERES